MGRWLVELDKDFDILANIEISGLISEFLQLDGTEQSLHVVEKLDDEPFFDLTGNIPDVFFGLIDIFIILYHIGTLIN